SRLHKIEHTGVDCEIVEKNLDVSITISSDINLEKFEFVKSKIYGEFKDETYASEEISLEALAAKLLKMTKNTLAVAESLTGGEICSRLCSVNGISENLFEGIVCYNRLSKMNRLGVSKDILANYGAVSRQTAHAMVKGLNNNPVTIGLATTGLAGPTGDEGKPVGLVYIAVGSGDFIPVFERHIAGSRNEIRESTANLALFYLVRYLQGNILRL
ncbi:MAG: nicotinamide-nucleotide amidohydrolase family protein, partial [Clostridia bacterium]